MLGSSFTMRCSIAMLSPYSGSLVAVEKIGFVLLKQFPPFDCKEPEGRYNYRFIFLFVDYSRCKLSNSASLRATCPLALER
jgi:hypothetical protein